MKREFGFVLALGGLLLSSPATHADAPPSAPALLRATAESPFEITLSWPDRSSREDRFRIERSTAGKDFAQIAELLANTTSYRDDGLLPDTEYFYRVTAWNAAGRSGFSNPARTRTLATACALSVAEWGDPNGTAPEHLIGVVAIEDGQYHRLALKHDGTVLGWGDDGYGQATPPTNLNSVVAIAAGEYHSLALKRDGTVVGWGSDYEGEATPPTNLTSVVAIAAGGQHSLALKNDGTVVIWGYAGQLAPPTNLTGVVAISAGQYHNLAMRSDGTVIGWSLDGNSQMTPPAGLTNVVAVAAGGYHNLALRRDGSVVGWGDNWDGQATPPTNLTAVTAIAAGTYHSLALRTDGTVIGWGYQGYEEPTPTTNLTGVVAIAAGHYHSMALTVLPAVPSALVTSIIGEHQIRLSWTDNSADANSFKIERAVEGDSGNLGAWASVGTAAVPATSFNDTDVSTNATFWYRVRAHNACGDSLYSEPTISRVRPPQPPDYVDIAIGTNNDAALSWFNGWPNVDGHKIERAPDVDGSPGAWTEIATVPFTNGVSGYFSDPGVTANLTYWYRLRAFNALGDSANTSPASLQLVPPLAPAGLSASAFADSANLVWVDPYYYRDGVTGFKIERALDNGGSPGAWAEIASITTSNNNYYYYHIDAGRSLDTTYWYRVRAHNWIGDSPYSSSASARIVRPNAPQSVAAMIGDTNQVNVSWYQSPSDQRGFKIESAPDVNGAAGVWTEIATLMLSNTSYGDFTDTNVLANTTNWYRIRAFNVLDNSDYSQPANIRIIPPPAPYYLSASPFADKVNLYWYEDYPGLIGGYKIERATDVGGIPGSWSSVTNVPGDSASFTDTGHAAGATYWYRVAAYNWIGTSPFSIATSATIVPPVAPNGLSAHIGTTNRVNLQWWAGYPNDEDGFLIERSTNGIAGTWLLIGTIYNTNGTGTYFTDSNAQANSTYAYRVSAFNAVGVSSSSEPFSINVIPPPAPSNLGAIPFANTINLSWQINYPGEISGYIIERAAEADGLPGSWMQITSVGGNVSSFRDTGRVAGVAYWYRVSAYNWIGSSPFCDSVAARNYPPPPPTSVSASVGNTNQVNLYFYSDSPYEQDGFLIERASDIAGAPGAWGPIGITYATNAYSAAFTDTNVLAFTTNWYRIRAFNAVGVSAYSTPVNIHVVPPPAPYYVYAYPFANQVNLSWYSYYYSSPVGGYQIDRATDVAGNPGTWSLIAVTTNNVAGHTDSGRAANTKYWYRVRAYNWVGVSTNSTLASVTIIPPVAPYVSAYIGTTNRVEVSLSAGSPQDQHGFRLERAPTVGNGPGQWTQIATIFATNSYYTYFTDTNVIANTTNWYRARAFNSVGISPFSSTTSVRVVGPPAPYSITATPSRDQVNLYWYVSYSGPIEGYLIERALDAGGIPGGWTQIKAITNNYNYFTDTGLTANTKYWYRVRAYSWAGLSPHSMPVSASISAPQAPYQPYGYVGTTNQVHLDWYAASYDQDGFRIERSPVIGGVQGAWAEIGLIYATNYSYGSFTDTNVLANTTNRYRVRAFSFLGVSAYSPVLTLPITRPPAPYYVYAYPFGNRAELSWSTDYYGEIAGYQIDRAPNVGGVPGVWSLVATTTNGVNYFTDSGLAANTRYWYRIRTYNWVGVSTNSTPISVTIVPPAAPYVYPALVASNRVEISLYPGNASDQHGFRLERAPTQGTSPGLWMQIATIFATNSYNAFFVDTNVTANTTNWYRARAFNAAGTSAYGQPASVRIMPPDQPSSLSAWAHISGRVNLYWYDYSGSPAGGYQLERATNTSSGPGAWVQIARLSGQNYTDYSANLGGSYWYRVRGFNWVGASVYSTPVGLNIPGVDADTLHLWHLDDVATPCFDFAYGGTNLTSLSGGATLGAISSSPTFGNCLGTFDGGQDLFGGTNSDAALTARGVSTPARVGYCDEYYGAFTYEALIHIGFDPAKNFGPVAAGGNGRNTPFFILNADGNINSQRIFQFRINPIGLVSSGTSNSVRLEFSNLRQGAAIQSIITSIPTNGPDAIVSNGWYHVAVAYDGSAGVPGNIKFYWTKFETNRTQATLLDGTRNMTASLSGWDNPTVFAIGNAGRNPGGSTANPLNANFVGQIDEVRISRVARVATNMLLTAYGPGGNQPVAAGQIPSPDGNGATTHVRLTTAEIASALQIVAVTPSGEDIRITWRTLGGTTNYVQAASSANGPFFNISPAIPILRPGVVEVNYLEVGAASHSSQRFYRVKLE